MCKRGRAGRERSERGRRRPCGGLATVDILAMSREELARKAEGGKSGRWSCHSREPKKEKERQQQASSLHRSSSEGQLLWFCEGVGEGFRRRPAGGRQRLLSSPRQRQAERPVAFPPHRQLMTLPFRTPGGDSVSLSSDDEIVRGRRRQVPRLAVPRRMQKEPTSSSRQLSLPSFCNRSTFFAFVGHILFS